MTGADLLRPRLGPWVVVHRPLAEGAPWIVERQGANPLRVSEDVGELLSAIDGQRDCAALVSVLGERWTSELVDGAVRKLGDLGLLVRPDQQPPKPERRFVLVSPTTLQLRLFRATRVLDPLRPALTRLSGKAVLVATVAVAVAGLLALIGQHAALGMALATPLPIAATMLIWLGIGATTIFHELSHGATLTHYRGRSGWFGVMLFYLTPACFCEVTDGWRLGRPGQRVAVAMAGVGAQATIAGLAALVALTLPDGGSRATLLGFALICYLSGLVNLVPWVKLDGYLALMAYLDIPHLREMAMNDARSWLTNRLFGIDQHRELPYRRWVVPYGLLCAGFPVVVLLLAAARWSHLLLAAGPIGAAMLLLLFGFLLYRLARSVVTVLRRVNQAGVSRARQATVGALIVLAIGLPLTFLKAHNDIRVGYVNDSAGVRLVLPPGTDPSALHPGDQVVLRRTGLLLGTDLGTATIGAGRSQPAEVPFSALMPFRSDVWMPATVLPVQGVSAPHLDQAGSATVSGEPISLGVWLLHNYFTPAWKQIFGKES